MRRVRRSTIHSTLVACLALVALAPPAGAAEVRVGPLILRADGGFTPRLLPQRTYAPIDFQGQAKILTTNGTVPPALRTVELEFDRDGLLTTAGLGVCQPGQIATASPRQARSVCKAAIVGSGRVGATVDLGGVLRVKVNAPLTLFNGPKQAGNPTVLAHTQTAFPLLETFVVPIPIERRGGLYRYRTEFQVPKLAGGLGALTDISVDVGRRYRSGGVERSYVSARCSDYILQTRGTFTFADETIVSGSVFKPCKPIP